MKLRYLLICGLIPFVLLSSTKSTTIPSKKKVQVYLLLGQSNMAGRGEITDQYKGVINERVVMLTKALTWVPAQHPLHFDKPKVSGVGPGLVFGDDIAVANKKDTIALVPCAVGGTSIDVWKPGAFDKATNTYPYDDALKRIRFAASKGEIKGVIWLQGESDSGSDEKIAAYREKLMALISLIRMETGQPQLPWVCGELGQFREKYQRFNKQLQQLPAHVKSTIVVSSEGLQHKGDSTHFNSESATLYGHRFAEAMMELTR